MCAHTLRAALEGRATEIVIVLLQTTPPVPVGTTSPLSHTLTPSHPHTLTPSHCVQVIPTVRRVRERRHSALSVDSRDSTSLPYPSPTALLGSSSGLVWSICGPLFETPPTQSHPLIVPHLSLTHTPSLSNTCKYTHHLFPYWIYICILYTSNYTFHIYTDLRMHSTRNLCSTTPTKSTRSRHTRSHSHIHTLTRSHSPSHTSQGHTHTSTPHKSHIHPSQGHTHTSTPHKVTLTHPPLTGHTHTSTPHKVTLTHPPLTGHTHTSTPHKVTLTHPPLTRSHAHTCILHKVTCSHMHTSPVQ